MGMPATAPVPLILRAAGLTDVGCVREQNEDAFLADADRRLFIVADGMGGRHGGDVASRRVVEILPGLVRRSLENLVAAKIDHSSAILAGLEDAVMETSRAVRAEGEKRFECLGMGAAIVAVLLTGHHAHIVHMGDSRAYLLRGNGLRQLTQDHSIVEALLRHGEISPQEAIDHPARGRLTRFAGMEPAAEPAGQTIEVRSGDRLLLCTDGLWGTTGNATIGGILSLPDDCAAICQALITAGKAAGGDDNLTALVVDVAEGPKA